MGLQGREALQRACGGVHKLLLHDYIHEQNVLKKQKWESRRRKKKGQEEDQRKGWSGESWAQDLYTGLARV